MKKLVCLFLVILLLTGLTAAVSAQSSATTAHSNITVNSNGTCRVVLNLNLVLDSAVKDLTFPLPQNAGDITVNGSHASVSSKNGVQHVSLSGITGGGAGNYTVSIAYQLSGAVTSTEEGMLLQLPLLSGFAYPINQFSFSIQLPGDVPQTPVFDSGYHQQTIIEHLDITTDGAVISGTAKSTMKDHETLTMTLPVTETMFPQSATAARLLGLTDVGSYVLLVIAALYFFLFMRPHFRNLYMRTTAPDGITAGEVGLWLTGQSMDFSLLVISWAQMGYLRIQVEPDGRILLHKRMEMGNERSAFENHYYRILFGRRRTVEGTGFHYARLARDMARQTGRLKEVFSGLAVHRLIFRGICILAAVLSGVVLAGGFAAPTIGLRIFMGLVTGLLAWAIQVGAGHILLRQRMRYWIGVGGAAAWFVISLFAGNWLAAGFMILLQTVAGFAAAFGGSRTPMGQQTMTQLLDLWLHFRLSSRKNLIRLMKVNPGYFHSLAPYALAMNADRHFARRFGKMQLPECTYLSDGRTRQLTATEWNELLRKTVNALDARANRLPIEQLTGK